MKKGFWELWAIASVSTNVPPGLIVTSSGKMSGGAPGGVFTVTVFIHEPTTLPPSARTTEVPGPAIRTVDKLATANTMIIKPPAMEIALRLRKTFMIPPFDAFIERMPGRKV